MSVITNESENIICLAYENYPIPMSIEIDFPTYTVGIKNLSSLIWYKIYFFIINMRVEPGNKKEEHCASSCI